MRPVHLDVTGRAVGVLRVHVVLWTGGLVRSDTVSRAMTRQTELSYSAGDQQAWIG